MGVSRNIFSALGFKKIRLSISSTRIFESTLVRPVRYSLCTNEMKNENEMKSAMI